MAEETNTFPKEVKLSDGRIAVINAYKGKHVMKAQKFAGTDTEKLLPELMAQVVEIDGKGVVLEDLEDMNGPDYMKLLGEFSESFT